METYSVLEEIATGNLIAEFLGEQLTGEADLLSAVLIAPAPAVPVAALCGITAGIFEDVDNITVWLAAKIRSDAGLLTGDALADRADVLAMSIACFKQSEDWHPTQAGAYIDLATRRFAFFPADIERCAANLLDVAEQLKRVRRMSVDAAYLIESGRAS